MRAVALSGATVEDTPLPQPSGTAAGPMLSATGLSKQYKGLPVEADVKAKLSGFKKDPAIRKEIKAMERLEKLRSKYKPSKRSDRKKLVAGLRSLQKKSKKKEARKVLQPQKAARLITFLCNSGIAS